MKMLVDNKMPDSMITAMAELGIETVAIPSFAHLPEPISSHPDILLYPMKNGDLLIGSEYYEKNRAFFDSLGLRYRISEKTPRGNYPNDVLFDALGIGDTLYGKDGYVCEELKSEYPRFVPVKQGYARCSVAMLSKRCAVTGDKGLEAALKRDGIDVLLIRPGNIKLEGYDTGFIGGAGGRLLNGDYLFFGDPLLHPDGESILDFASYHKIKTVSLSGLPLSDHGGFLVI